MTNGARSPLIQININALFDASGIWILPAHAYAHVGSLTSRFTIREKDARAFCASWSSSSFTQLPRTSTRKRFRATGRGVRDQMYIYKFRACRLFRFSRRRARCIRCAMEQVFRRFNRIIICFLSQFYLYHSNRAVVRTTQRTFAIADQHLDSRISITSDNLIMLLFMSEIEPALRSRAL